LFTLVTSPSNQNTTSIAATAARRLKTEILAPGLRSKLPQV
jgi:hypothetical protein